MYQKVTTTDIEFFKKVVGSNNVFSETEIHEEYSHDEMVYYGKYLPEVVLKVKTDQEISEILKYCNEKSIPITPRGSGTGLCGGCVALHGGVVLSLEKMKKIIEIDQKTMTAVIEPGVLLMELADTVEALDLFYAPDPGERSATVGGNVVTNAGGMRAVKYGVTKDYVKGVEVVLANGEILKFGGKTNKNSSGYNLKDLMISSEGTLGIITKLYLKLLPKPRKMVSLLIPFSDLKTSLEVVPNILNLPNVPTTLEFMEQEVILDAQEYLGKPFPSKEFPAYLIVSYSGNNDQEIDLMVKECADIVLGSGAIDVFISDTEERQDSIWSARGAFLEAIKNSTPLMDECDVVLEIDKIYEFMEFVKGLAKKYQVRIRSFGHAGDGNLHIYVCQDELSDEKFQEIAEATMAELYQKADAMDGQVSGEHGIGHAKKVFLKESLGPTQIALMQGIKDVFDPKQILNPGKIIN